MVYIGWTWENSHWRSSVVSQRKFRFKFIILLHYSTRLQSPIHHCKLLNSSKARVCECLKFIWSFAFITAGAQNKQKILIISFCFISLWLACIRSLFFTVTFERSFEVSITKARLNFFLLHQNVICDLDGSNMQQQTAIRSSSFQ
jgi:hypothetical protein